MKEKALVSKGNKKLPKSTWIFNSGSAKNCPSKALGLCQACDKCYALKAERQYPPVFPYRERQYNLTQTQTSKAFCETLLNESKRARIHKMLSFRFNEAGDFHTQKQLNWFTEVCTILNENKIKCYGYTARTDLNLSKLMEVANVNVSNDQNNWIDKGANRFKMVKEPVKNKLTCKGDCRICKLCQTQKGKLIQVKEH